MQMTPIALTWDRGEAWIEPVGAMLGPVRFTLDSGRSVVPLAVAPWSDDTGPDHAALPGLMQRLRGEWPCVPFGAPTAPDGLPDAWAASPVPDAGAEFHGYASHNVWRLEESGAGYASLAIDYPDDHVVRRLRRTIRGMPGQAAIELTLEIAMRRSACLPIALHPVFRLPDRPGALTLDPGPFGEGRVYPVPVEPGVSRLAPGALFDDLAAVPGVSAAQALDHLPLSHDTEEIVQLCGARGEVRLTDHDAGYVATLRYDPERFPSVLLWLSNRGRTAYPWNGRFLGLGVEPLCGAFDLGPEIGANPDNPIARSGHATCLPLDPDTPFRSTYRIAVEDHAR